MPQQRSAHQMASQIDTSMMFVHRTNIERYKWLLTTDLSEGDRTLIKRRLAEEEALLLKLAGK
ncbi:MAG TPA: hypothetical protein VMM15_03315 [Bradyrhizobium sp.]|nr:hypothetical protein [Bradyrhizobium sp.]